MKQARSSPMLRLPLFIVFEGIDGSGKSSQWDLLADYLVSQSLPVAKLFEPTDGEWGRKIRNFLRGDKMPQPRQQLDLFIRDRKDDLRKNILPALRSGKIIVMDRYYYSNAAYQGAAGIPPDTIIGKNKKFPLPDRVYLIDIDPVTALQRITERNDKKNTGGKELFEKEAFLKKVREIYLSITDDRFIVIDGSQDRHDIFTQIKKDIEMNFRA